RDGERFAACCRGPRDERAGSHESRDIGRSNRDRPQPGGRSCDLADSPPSTRSKGSGRLPAQPLRPLAYFHLLAAPFALTSNSPDAPCASGGFLRALARRKAGTNKEIYP